MQPVMLAATTVGYAHGLLVQHRHSGATNMMPSSTVTCSGGDGRISALNSCKTCLRSRVSASDGCKPSSVLPWQDWYTQLSETLC